MTTVASDTTGVDADTTGLANGTTVVAVDVQVDTDVDEVMDIDVDNVDAASVNSSRDTKPEGTEELEGTDEFECLELASELDSGVGE